MQNYPHVFKPIKVRSFEISNRVVMGSMHTGLEENWGYGPLARYYEERAKGGVGLIITGGISPNWQGMVKPFGARMTNGFHVWQHKHITDAVHKYPTKIVMQILHTGRYGYHPLCVSPSAIKSPISMFKPKALSAKGVEKTIDHFVRCAVLAKKAGYDGVEVMGSEGYLINQFTCSRTNKRKDKWGGSFENRVRFPLEILQQMRKAAGEDFLIVYRISLLDLVEDGMPFEEIREFALLAENAGVDIFNTGIGWHEARVPTIAGVVPHGAYTWITNRLKESIKTPIIAVNRINRPEVAEKILANKEADFVSLARPLLADPAFVSKAEQGKSSAINTCIACNQACLDYVFTGQNVSCLVNPSAGHEAEFDIPKNPPQPKKVAVVGGGPAGMACALKAAKIGHDVTIYEEKDRLGGQFLLAKEVPGKSDYGETIRYFSNQLAEHNVTIKLNYKANEKELVSKGYDKVVIACGVLPTIPSLPGIESKKVLTYEDVLFYGKEVGKNVAIIGAGGIGIDVAEFLLEEEPEDNEVAINAYLDTWGVDRQTASPGGLKPPVSHPPKRNIYLLKRSSGGFGKELGKTTGWIRRALLKKNKVNMLSEVSYKLINDEGLVIVHKGKEQQLTVDTIIICAGQKERNGLYEKLSSQGFDVECIGGAKKASGLDAVRAIREGETLALHI